MSKEIWIYPTNKKKVTLGNLVEEFKIINKTILDNEFPENQLKGIIANGEKICNSDFSFHDEKGLINFYGLFEDREIGISFIEKAFDEFYQPQDILEEIDIELDNYQPIVEGLKSNSSHFTLQWWTSNESIPKLLFSLTLILCIARITNGIVDNNHGATDFGGVYLSKSWLDKVISFYQKNIT